MMAKILNETERNMLVVSAEELVNELLKDLVALDRMENACTIWAEDTQEEMQVHITVTRSRKDFISETDRDVRRCRKCGCTDDDCSQCIEATGEACHWIELDLCSACGTTN